MADKPSLRDLQIRLAERLQAARTSPRRRGWLAVFSAGARLLLPLAQAGEIMPLRAASKLPHAKPWLAGVVQLRGDLYSVVDLAVFLGLRAGPSVEPAASAGRLVMLNPALLVNAALRIDRLAGLRDEEQLERQADVAAAHPAFAAGRWKDAQGAVWQELDLAALAADPAFLDVAQ